MGDVPQLDYISGSYLTTTGASKALAVSAGRIRQLVNQDELEAVCVGRELLIDEASIERYKKRYANRPRRGPQPGQGGRPKQQEKTQ